MENYQNIIGNISLNAFSYDWIVVGSGLAGAVFAREATDKGFKVLVIEKNPMHAGGALYTTPISTNGGTYHTHVYGPHIFHTSDKKILDYFLKYVDAFPFINSPLADYKGEIYNLPFNMNTLKQIYDVTSPIEAKKILDDETRPYQDAKDENLEQRALSMVGPKIYNILVKEYTEKQWGKECKDLPAYIISRLPVRLSYDNNYFNDIWSYMPKEGYSKLIENLLEGIKIVKGLNVNIKNIDEILELGKRVFFTGVIEDLLDIDTSKLNQKYRSLRWRHEIIDDSLQCDIANQGVAVINKTSSAYEYTRTIDHSYFGFKIEQSLVDKRIISYEYPSPYEYGFNEPYYPIQDEKNNDEYRIMKESLKTKYGNKIVLGGRAGLFRYMDMDKTIASTLDICQKELSAN